LDHTGGTDSHESQARSYSGWPRPSRGCLSPRPAPRPPRAAAEAPRRVIVTDWDCGTGSSMRQDLTGPSPPGWANFGHPRDTRTSRWSHGAGPGPAPGTSDLRYHQNLRCRTSEQTTMSYGIHRMRYRRSWTEHRMLNELYDRMRHPSRIRCLHCFQVPGRVHLESPELEMLGP
jgi:hypothetical protein